MPNVADVARAHGPAYLARHDANMPPTHRRVLADITACGTGALGGRVVLCADCGRRHYVLLSCRNRMCPHCHGRELAAWLGARAGELLPVTYFHLTFTLPCELRPLARSHQNEVLDALMRTAADALQTVAGDPRFAGGRLAMLAVLHTAGRALQWHPHVHLLVPGVAIEPDGTWRRLDRFLVYVPAVVPVFRAKFVAALRRALPGVVLPDRIWRLDWVIGIRRCDEGPTNVANYLARYLFGGPMRGRTLSEQPDARLRLTYPDSNDGTPRHCTVTPDEFLRRYLQHTLPPGFHRIRYYGWWAPSARPVLRRVQLQLAPGLLQRAKAVARLAALADKPVPCCPACGSTRLYVIAQWRAAAPMLPLNRGPPAA
jgi:hypothetical protein